MAHVAGREAANGLRPADVRRDLRGIADLLEEAFASELDEIGQRILREMRFWSRLGWLLKGLEWFLPPGEAFVPGYVWVEDGRVVGYAMVRRFQPGLEGWLIANVAVAPEFRGEGDRSGAGRSLSGICSGPWGPLGRPAGSGGQHPRPSAVSIAGFCRDRADPDLASGGWWCTILSDHVLWDPRLSGAARPTGRGVRPLRLDRCGREPGDAVV